MRFLERKNFVAQFIWQKRTSPDARKKISDGHEYIVMYCKVAELLNDAVSLLPLSDKDKENYEKPR